MADNLDIQEQIFNAIDVITSKRLNDLEFDKTLKCSIVDSSQAAKGEYTVTDGSSTFLAYSDYDKYRVGNKVYVTVPNGDMVNTKIITGKVVSSEDEYYTYVSPMEKYVDITNNLIAEDFNFGLIANGAISGLNDSRVILK